MQTLVTIHRYLGEAIVAVLLSIALVGLGLRLRGALRRRRVATQPDTPPEARELAEKDPAPGWLWVIQHYTENVLLLQVVIGVILFVSGRRVVGGPLIWLHYLYGSLFPLIAIVGGRIAALRREHSEYVGLTWGAFFAFGLTLRALMTGLHIGV